MFTKLVNHHSDMFFFTFLQLTFMGQEKSAACFFTYCFTIIQFDSLTNVRNVITFLCQHPHSSVALSIITVCVCVCACETEGK